MRTKDDILDEMNTIVNGAEGRKFTDAEAKEYDGLKAELVQVQRDEEIRKHNAALNAPNGPTPRTGAGKPKAEDTVDAAFQSYLRTGRPNADIAHLAVGITNAQAEGAGSTGGYLVPTTFRKKLVDRMKAFGGLANHVDNLETTDGAPIEWPTIDDTSNEGEIVPENNTFVGGADLVFGTASLGAYKYMTGGASALPLRVPVELLQDAAFDVEKLVSDKLGERLARIMARHLVTGTGVAQPLGIVTGRTPVQMAANTGITYADLVNIVHSVDPAYRGPNCKWAMNDTTLATIEKITDSHGDPLWRRPDAGMGEDFTSGRLLGYPVVIDQSFVDYDADDSTDLCGVFGDLREGYVRRKVRDTVVIVNPWTRANYGQVEFTAWARMDATQQNTNAYVVFSGKS
jgi:HK97 family phage major capsid protein